MVPSAPASSWHNLFAPLPADIVPRRTPVALPEVLKLPQAEAIAGWHQLTIELSAGEAGMRVAMVVLDADGRPISASDMVMHRSQEAEGRVRYVHENVGGRLEADERFFGTRWRSVVVENAAGEQLQSEHIPSAPSEQDVTAMKSLIAEIARRAGD
ncbi:MAG TPA: hypothetical protein VJS66_06630 [Burkholderiales bacterium]|nr:hypothetical protein [Burkholderiales bacterium]